MEDPTHRLAGALHWIADLLQRTGIPFQVVGGVAVVAYGATRPVADIDLYIPAEGLPRLMRRASARVVRQPWRHRDEWWDRILCALEHEGQRIEVGVAGAARFRDLTSGEWTNAAIDFDASVLRTVWGVEVPVMPLAQIVWYKQQLGREIDARDLAELARTCGEADGRWRLAGETL